MVMLLAEQEAIMTKECKWKQDTSFHHLSSCSTFSTNRRLYFSNASIRFRVSEPGANQIFVLKCQKCLRR